MGIITHPEKCTGCRFCELICSIVNERVVNPERSRIRILRKDLKNDVPIVCNQCGECIDNCPSNAIYRKDAIVLIDDEKCTGCGICVDVCPIDAVKIMNGRVVKCDECGGEPECVKYCTQGGITHE